MKITKELLIEDLLDTEANGFDDEIIEPFWEQYMEEITDDSGNIIAEAITEEKFKDALNDFLIYVVNFIKSAKD